MTKYRVTSGYWALSDGTKTEGDVVDVRPALAESIQKYGITLEKLEDQDHTIGDEAQRILNDGTYQDRLDFVGDVIDDHDFGEDGKSDEALKESIQTFIGRHE